MYEKELPDHIYQRQFNFFGQKFAGATLSKINLTSEHFGLLNAWLKKKSGMLVLCGNPGCGKTYICSALVAYMHNKFDDIYAIKEYNFLSKIRASFSMQGDYVAEVAYQTNHDFFIFDDLGSSGKGSETGWRMEILFEIINNRYESSLPSVFTTNLNPQDLKELIGFRAASRLYSSENTVLHMWDYPDLRKPSYMHPETQVIENSSLNGIKIVSFKKTE